jgi:hypothetical protein
MTATIKRVASVEDHPKKPQTVSVVRTADGVQFVAQKVDKLDGAVPRYAVGSLVTFLSDGSLAPEYLLRQGYWDEEAGKGLLRGSKGDRVKAANFSEVMSDGIHFPVEQREDASDVDQFYVANEANEHLTVHEGDDVSGFLGVKEWEQPK